jgi:hypothetical protein
MEKHRELKDNWNTHGKAIELHGLPAGNRDGPVIYAFPNTSDKKGETGFFDLTPENPYIQKNYDAMQGSWGGVEASNKAISRGLFKAEAMPFSPPNKK